MTATIKDLTNVDGQGGAFVQGGKPRITVLTAPNKALTKQFRLEQGVLQKVDYDRPYNLGYTVHPFDGIEELWHKLLALRDQPNSFIIRGSPLEGLPSEVRRLTENFPDQGTSWTMVDFDRLPLPEGVSPYSEDAVRYAIGTLPAEFQDVTTVAAFSASAGILDETGKPLKAGFNAHLWFCLDRATQGQELKNWLRDTPVDLSLFSAVQPHYTADPIIGEGVVCELPERMLFVRGTRDIVAVPEGLEKAKASIRREPLGFALEGFGEGNRNDGLFRYAAGLRGRGVSYDEARVLVMIVAAECTPPLKEHEALGCLESAYGRYEPGTIVRPCTDTGNAERFRDRFGANVRYIPAFNKWFYWDGQRWQEDKLGQIDQWAKDTVRGIQQEAAQVNDLERRDALLKWGRQSESAARRKAMIELARSEPGICLSEYQLDSDDWLFGVANGTVDLKTGQLREACREDYITKASPILYDPQATCPTWERFISQVMGGKGELVAYLQLAIGYALTGSTAEQCMFILHGYGANGKSTFLQVLNDLSGSYAKNVSAETFMVTRASGNGPSGDIARLQGARMTLTTETDEGQQLSEGLIKRLTGEDVITARFLYGENFEFKPKFKVCMAANHKPIIRGDDHAIWRRIRLIPFTETFAKEKQDKTLPTKLRAELPGILNWAIQGCLQWQRDGLATPAEVLSATQDYRNELDLVGNWISENCVIGSEHEDKASCLYADFKEWARDNSEYQMPQRKFSQKLVERGFLKRKASEGIIYQGIIRRYQLNLVEQRSGDNVIPFHSREGTPSYFPQPLAN